MRLRAFRHLSLAATGLVFLVLYGFAASKYEGFLTLRVYVNLLGDDSFLAIAAVGMAFTADGSIRLGLAAVTARFPLPISSPGNPLARRDQVSPPSVLL